MKKDGTFPIEVAEDYDKIMAYFDYSKSAEIIESLLKRFGVKEDSPVLEIGIGSGKLASLLSAKSNYTILGIDHSPAMLKECRKQFPSIKVELSDVVEYVCWTNFGAVISHAGPFRLNHSSTLGLSEVEEKRLVSDVGALFFESYIRDEVSISRAIENLSGMMLPNSLMLLYIQQIPGRNKLTRSTPDEMDFQEKHYTKITTYKNGILSKSRSVYRAKVLLWTVRHTFCILPLGRFNEICRRNSLEIIGTDNSKHFYCLRRIA